MTEKRVFIQAPAKLNLGLRILGKRPDGFHELDSVFHTVNLHDDLLITRTEAPGIQFRCRGISVPEDETNLIHQAATLGLRELGLSFGVSIDLEKRIPVGAGLGGGSSDAAAVLLGLCSLANLDPTPGLIESAAELGADIPFFFVGGTARCQGKGERVESLESRNRFFFVLLVPLQPVPTNEVYRNLNVSNRSFQSNTELDPEVARFLTAKGIGRFLANDLEDSVFELFPSIRSCRDAFQELASPHRVSLTGSGGGLFCACPTPLLAQEIGGRLDELHLGTTFLVQSCSRAKPIEP